MDIREEIGAAMAKARIKSGLSRSEIARRMGVSDVSVYYWETGRNPITVDKLDSFCKVLNIDMIDLLSSIPSYRK